MIKWQKKLILVYIYIYILLTNQYAYIFPFTHSWLWYIYNLFHLVAKEKSDVKSLDLYDNHGHFRNYSSKKKKKKKMRKTEKERNRIVIERVNLAKYFASVRERFFYQCFFQNMHMYTFRFQYIKWEIYYTCTSDRVFGYSVTLALYQELYCKRRALFYSPILNMCTMTPFEKANL